MTNEELIAKIKAEIERQHNLSNEKRVQARRTKDYYNEVAYGAEMGVCNRLRSFLSDLEKSLSTQDAGGNSEIPKDLEEAAIQYAMHKKKSEEKEMETELPMGAYFLAMDSFIAGAKWHKEQMMEGAIEGVITNAGGEFGCDVATFRFDDNHTYSVLLPHEEKRKYGDKVHIIIVKED